MTAPPPTPKPSGPTIAAVVLGVVALLLWLLQLATVFSLGRSDPAGNAIGQAYAAIQIILLWLALTVMTSVASLKGTAPRPAKFAALIIVPFSGVVALAAADLLARPEVSPFLWPVVIPALVPPLVVAWCFLALRAAALRPFVTRVVATALLGATLAVCASLWPFWLMRNAADGAETARREKYDADLARVPANAPLWDWTPFLDTRDDTRRAKVLDSIRSIDQRQAQAESMLDRGDFPIRYLGFFDLDPTPALCAKARNLLRSRVGLLELKTPNARPYADIAGQVSDAVAAMEWLVGYDCPCDAESTAWETTAKGYSNTNFDVYRLAELRDPRELGRALRERPERFSMLNGKSHLKGWLRFADDERFRDQALAGARGLDHRTSDAVEILLDKYDEESRWSLLRHLRALDLEATAAFCVNALNELHGQFTKVYRPGANDEPRPYSELLERLGNGEQLPDLVWLAGHGCAADTELNEAVNLAEAYGDSPGRTEMLATLAQLRSPR
jgi:hypothetical protein